ncbi:MAG: hypothetical protein Kow0063_25510 [Anaerolineae bacterium]
MIHYIISFPERLIRATAAGLGGVIYQSTLILLPEWVRGARFYQATFARLLRITVELVGGVQGVFPTDDMPVQQLAARKLAGNAVELLSFAAVGWSPVWLLAAAADVTGGTQFYLRTLVEDLRREGVLPPDARIGSIDELFTLLEQNLGQAADTVDMPPLNVEDMRASWRRLRDNAHNLPGPDRLARIYRDLQAVARQEGRSIYTTSSLIALGALRTGIRMGNMHIFDYYRDALNDIGSEGLDGYVKRVVAPYRLKVIHHFSPHNQTYTERYLLGRRGGG